MSRAHTNPQGAADTQPADPSELYSRAEIVTGLVWLSIGALISVLLEVVYLTSWVPLPGGRHFVAPYTVLIAFFFNRILVRTGLLWSRRTLVAGVPLWAWLAGYLGLTFLGAATGDKLLPSDVRSILLLLAGLAGGAWPLMSALTQQLETKTQQ